MTKRDTARQARYVEIDDDVVAIRGGDGGGANDDEGDVDCDGAVVDVDGDSGIETTRLLQRRLVRRRVRVSQTH